MVIAISAAAGNASTSNSRIDIDLDRTSARFPDHRYPFSSINCSRTDFTSSHPKRRPVLNFQSRKLHFIAWRLVLMEGILSPVEMTSWPQSNYVQWKFPRAIYVTCSLSLLCVSCLSPLSLKISIRKFCFNLSPTQIYRARANSFP